MALPMSFELTVKRICFSTVSTLFKFRFVSVFILVHPHCRDSVTFLAANTTYKGSMYFKEMIV